MTKYPHEGVMPGMGCGCPSCQQPHKIDRRAVEPGTPEHEEWLIEQERKRQTANAKHEAWGVEVGRPKHWR